MGEARKEALRVDFDSRIKLEFYGASVASDAGLVVYRKLDEALGLTMMADGQVRRAAFAVGSVVDYHPCA